MVFGISGLALNHAADWNPSYRQTKTVVQITPIVAGERDGMVAEALQKLEITQTPLNAFRPDPDTLQLFFEGRTYRIDAPTGQVIVEDTRPRPVLFELNQMHLNASKGLWTVIADVYAVALIMMAMTGMFVLRGRVGLAGRGKWLAAIGALIPIAYWAYTIWLRAKQ